MEQDHEARTEVPVVLHASPESLNVKAWHLAQPESLERKATD